MSDGILVFAGKQVGLECLSHLFSINAPVLGVIVGTQQDGEIIELCKKNGIEAIVHEAETQQALIEDGRRYEWILSLWNPHILKSEVLDLAKHRLNTHPSLAPNCRGNDTAAWMIRSSSRAGVSLLEINSDVDDGDVFIQKEVKYGITETGKQLYLRMLDEMVSLFKESWSDIYTGKITPTLQKGDVTHHTRKDTNKDRVIDLSENATFESFIRRINAHDFSPNTTAEVDIDGKRFKVTLGIEEK